MLNIYKIQKKNKYFLQQIYSMCGTMNLFILYHIQYLHLNHFCALCIYQVIALIKQKCIIIIINDNQICPHFVLFHCMKNGSRWSMHSCIENQKEFLKLYIYLHVEIDLGNFFNRSILLGVVLRRVSDDIIGIVASVYFSIDLLRSVVKSHLNSIQSLRFSRDHFFLPT